MVWYDKTGNQKYKLPEIEEISVDIPAISEHLDAFRLPDLFKTLDTDTLPVIDITGEIIGIISEYDLAKIISDCCMSEDSYMFKVKVSDIMTREVWVETAHTNIEELLLNLPEMHTRVVPIVDKDQIYTGMSITRTALLDYLTKMVKPRSIGGLATPLGVYMTDGVHQSGSKTMGLISLGITLSIFATSLKFIMLIIGFYTIIPPSMLNFVEITIFLTILKITPLSQIHAAEHKTINAIEKGLPLTISSVRMQSRVHRRCGTNFMVFIFGIISILFLAGVLFSEKELLMKFLFSFFGFLIISSYWQSIGEWVQKYFTTREPNDKQIENGIQAGEELLRLHKKDTSNKQPNFFIKIWNMGLVQIIFSFITTTWVINTYILKLL